jgi:hypothetical protein
MAWYYCDQVVMDHAQKNNENFSPLATVTIFKKVNWAAYCISLYPIDKCFSQLWTKSHKGASELLILEYGGSEDNFIWVRSEVKHTRSTDLRHEKSFTLF